MPRTYVPGEGKTPSSLMIVGERPGHEEVIQGRPFVGPSGIELFGGEYEERVSRHRTRRIQHTGLWERYVGIPRTSLYITNLVKDFRGGNNPEPWEVDKWSPALLEELGTVQPQTIVAMGAWAARYFLPDYNADHDHGIPHVWRHGDRPITVIGCLHPAYALRQPEMQSALAWDLRQVRRVLDGDPQIPLEPYLRRPGLVPIAELVALFKVRGGGVIGLDTEGTEAVPECVSVEYGFLASVCYPADGLRDVQWLIEHATSVCLHNAVYDFHVLRRLGLVIDRFEDTMLMARLAGEFEGEQGLKALAWRRLRIQMAEYMSLVQPVDDAAVRQALSNARYQWEYQYGTLTKDQLKTPPAKALKKQIASAQKIMSTEAQDSPRRRVEKSKVLSSDILPPPTTWLTVPASVREPYAAMDPWATRLLHDDVAADLKAKKLDRVYRINKAILPMLARMESRGVRVDTERLRTITADFATEYDHVCFQIAKLVGRAINPNAPEDVARLLFVELGVTPTRTTKGGKHPTTEDKYLEARKHEHPVISLIIKAREWKKMEGYCTGALEKAQKEGDISVIHPDFRYTRVVSGRLAEWLLTIPKHSAAGKKIRSAFLARLGRTLLSMDMSQIELRAAAHLSRDPTMCRIYTEGTIDIHTNTAHSVLGAPAKKELQDESLHRLPAKTTNFSILMGTTEYGLADSINEALASAFYLKHNHVGEPGTDFKLWTPDDGRELIDGWYRTYPGVSEYNARQLDHARSHGYVADVWGRRRYVAGVYSHNRWIREAAEREAQSFAYQASAQGLMHLWMGKVWRLMEGWAHAEPWLQVHDDLTLEVLASRPAYYARQCIAVLPQPWSIPVASDAKNGQNWAELTALAI